MDYQIFLKILRGGEIIHLAGIGGISMRALARCLQARGAAVQGSDRDDSPVTQALRQDGIPVAVGHEAENLGDARLVIRTAAINDQNPEIAAARAAGIPVCERAEAWGFLMRDYGAAVCIAGTHGKTSTTSMAAMVALEAGLDPTIMVGGELSAIGGPLRLGEGELFIAEADEYRNSFLHFLPTVGVILNIDRDHVDFFGNVEDTIASFRTYAGRTVEGGVLVINADDPKITQAVDGLGKPAITFGLSGSADVWPQNPAQEGGFYRCTVMVHDAPYADIALKVPGKHNLMNALAVAAVAWHLNIPGPVFARGIAGYTGVGRRFEFKKAWRDARLFDDYAHHPAEIRATLETARAMAAGRVICVFQPHTYSRTAGLMDDFAEALSLCDVPVICPIFAAREQPMEGVSAETLAQKTAGGRYADSLEAAARMVESVVKPGDLILTMGAGDVWKIGDMLSL